MSKENIYMLNFSILQFCVGPKEYSFCWGWRRNKIYNPTLEIKSNCKIEFNFQIGHYWKKRQNTTKIMFNDEWSCPIHDKFCFTNRKYWFFVWNSIFRTILVIYKANIHYLCEVVSIEYSYQFHWFLLGFEINYFVHRILSVYPNSHIHVTRRDNLCHRNTSNSVQFKILIYPRRI